MKKWAVLFLCLALATALCACGGTSGKEEGGSEVATASSGEPVPTSEETAENPEKDGEYDRVFTMQDPFDVNVTKTIAVTHQTNGVVYDLADTNFSDFQLDEFVELNSAGEEISSTRYYTLTVPATAAKDYISSCEHFFLGLIVEEEELPVRNVTIQSDVDNMPAISLSLKWDSEKGWISYLFMAPDEYKAEYQSSELFRQYDTDARFDREMDQLLSDYTGS